VTTRAAAWLAGVGLVVAAAIPAAPALGAEDPLPPCTPGATADPIAPGLPRLPLVPLVPGAPRLPGIAYCDPSLPLPADPTAPLPDPLEGPVDGLVDPLLGGGLPLPELPVPDPVPSPAPTPPLAVDEQAPTFTQPAAQAGAESLEIGGLQSVGLVLVRTIDGQQVPVIRIAADSIAINGFMLDVRPDADSAAAVNDSDRLEMNGSVRVYLQSLTATGPDGLAISLLAPTPPPGDELPPTLLRVTFGLVGATADSSAWIHTHLRIVE